MNLLDKVPNDRDSYETEHVVSGPHRRSLALAITAAAAVIAIAVVLLYPTASEYFCSQCGVRLLVTGPNVMEPGGWEYERIIHLTPLSKVCIKNGDVSSHHDHVWLFAHRASAAGGGIGIGDRLRRAIDSELVAQFVSWQYSCFGDSNGQHWRAVLLDTRLSEQVATAIIGTWPKNGLKSNIEFSKWWKDNMGLIESASR